MRYSLNRPRLSTWLFPLLQGSLIVVLIPLAHATPQDPLWIPGIYDDADQDDVVGLLLDDEPATTPPSQAAEFAFASCGVLVAARPSLVSLSDRAALRLRSPPSPTL